MSIYDSENDRFADTDILIRDDKKGGNGFLIADKCIVFGYPLLSVAWGVFLFSGTLKLSVIIAVIIIATALIIILSIFPVSLLRLISSCSL